VTKSARVRTGNGANMAGKGHVSIMTSPQQTKKQQSRYTPCRRLRERRYSSYSFTTSALDGDEWSTSRPGRALPPAKGPPVPIVQEFGWAPEPVWTQRIEEKSFAPALSLCICTMHINLTLLTFPRCIAGCRSQRI
jgi:hypothetical protein